MNKEDILNIVNENPEVENMSFQDIEITRLNIDFVLFMGCVFEDCTFINDIAEELEFEDCKFINCKFRGEVGHRLVEFVRCEFQNCELSNIDYQAIDYQASFSSNKFVGCNLQNVDISLDLMFMNNNMSNCMIEGLSMFTNMIMKSVFENVIIKNSEFKCNIKNSYMTNVVLENTKFWQLLKGNKATNCLLDDEEYGFYDQEGEFRG